MELKNNFTYTKLIGSSQATNNVASAGVDLKEYTGQCAVLVNIGTKSTGDNDANVTLLLQESATNSAAAATNISGASNTTTNNTTVHAVHAIDPAPACVIYSRAGSMPDQQSRVSRGAT
jgi:hypothetical protein